MLSCASTKKKGTASAEHAGNLGKKTALALLDYSNPFDRIWREDLLIKAIDKEKSWTCLTTGSGIHY